MIRRARKIDMPKNQQEGLIRFAELIREFNLLIEKGNVTFNDDSHLIEGLVFPPNMEIEIPHKLGIRPKFRIILNQEGNGVLTDIPSGWNKNSIKMINNGSVQVTATILIMRE